MCNSRFANKCTPVVENGGVKKEAGILQKGVDKRLRF
jgi:hypothetical protein